MRSIYLLFFLNFSICSISYSQNIVSSSKLVERQGIVYQINSDIPFTGNTLSTYPSGQKELEGSYFKGKKTGKWLTWASNGQKTSEEYYNNGIPNGRFNRWLENGQLLEDRGFINGAPDGKWTIYNYDGTPKFDGWYKYGQLDSLINEYDFGGLLKSTTYKNGKLNGSYFERFSNGSSVRCGYKDNKLSGVYTEYYSTGNLAMSGTYLQGIRQGEFTFNLSTGLKKVNFKDGLKEGPVNIYSYQKTFAPDGKMRASMNYLHDKLSGKYIAWSEIGNYDLFIADESDKKLAKPASVGYEKMEGCFIDGNPTGIFKFWMLNFNGVPINTYNRLLFENGLLVDNGVINQSNWCAEYNSKDDLIDSYRTTSEKEGTLNRFAKKYSFPCEQNFQSSATSLTENPTSAIITNIPNSNSNYIGHFNDDYSKGEYQSIYQFLAKVNPSYTCPSFWKNIFSKSNGVYLTGAMFGGFKEYQNKDLIMKQDDTLSLFLMTSGITFNKIGSYGKSKAKFSLAIEIEDMKGNLYFSESVKKDYTEGENGMQQGIVLIPIKVNPDKLISIPTLHDLVLNFLIKDEFQKVNVLQGFAIFKFENPVSINSLATKKENSNPETNNNITKNNLNVSTAEIDGISYKSVIIGTQTWMVENLKTTKYNDGTDIPLFEGKDKNWAELITPAYCWYDKELKNRNTYGALYNWFTVATGKLCPKGWHVPTHDEWQILISYCGGEEIAGGYLKEAGVGHWQTFNNGSSNSTGFTALPGGIRYYTGVRIFIKEHGYWWSSTPINSRGSWSFGLNSEDYKVERSNPTNVAGLSVRCLKDT
jgi:uncharacterized protein (TIGR02145 family)